MRKFGKFISNHYMLVVIIGLLLLIPSVFGYFNTRINYDILGYLPKNLDSTKGEKILDKTYSDASMALIVVNGMESKDIVTMKDKMKKVNGVEDVLWLDDALDISIPKEMLPDYVKKQMYNGNSTLMVVKLKESSASETTQHSIDGLRDVMGKQCYLSGMSAILKDTKDLADKEAPFYIILAVVFSLVVLILSMESTLVPIIFLVCIGIGILYNMGTNIFLGEISYITKALAAVLQLGVTMDYSIFLMHRYDEKIKEYEDKRDAMAEAISATMLSISGSSLTTIAGFLALCTMDLTLGKDIGIVMAKGVIIGVICAVTVLPAFILAFDKPIHRSTHKIIIPNFAKVSRIVTKHYKAFIAVFVIAFIPAVFGERNASVYYNLDESLPKSMASIVGLNKLKDNFNMMTTHFVLIDKTVDNYKVNDMTKQIEKLSGVESVLSYEKFIGPLIPDEFIPDKVKDIFKQGNYNLLLVNSSYKSAQTSENEQIDKITKIVKSYDQGAMVTGEGPLTKDLITIADSDFKKVSVASILAIFVIIMFVFKSVSIPIILVGAIELAIEINMGIPYYTGSIIPFISSIVIGTIQLGATVDYAILLTSRFNEELNNGSNKKDAIRIALEESAKSITTSGLTFFAATAGVAMISDMALIKSLCLLIARGALISMAVIIFILPSLLYVFEGVIAKTSLHWRKNKNLGVKANKGITA